MNLVLAPARRASKGLTLAPARAVFRFKPPIVNVGGVPLFAQAVDWDFIPGSAPFRTALQFVDGPQFERIRAIRNPTTLRMVFDGAINNTPAPFDLTIRNVFLGPPRRVDAFHWLVELTDLRSQWEGQKFTWTANRTWRKNEYGEAAVVSDPADPARVRAEIDRFARFRYLPWSIHPVTKRPWTALDLLEKCLKGLYGGHAIENWATDNGVIRENADWKEEPVQPVLDDLAEQARVGFGISEYGSIRIYDLDSTSNVTALMPVERPPIAGGVLYLEDNRRIRPTRSAVRFEKRKETLIVASTASLTAPPNEPIIGPTRDGDTPIRAEDYKTGRAVACINVVKTPRDITHNGVTWQKGTWVPMSVFLDAVGLTDQNVREMWFGDLLTIYHAVLNAGRDLSSPPDPLRYMEAVAIKQAYRQQWQMDPYWVTRWESWDTRRAALVDPVNRFSLPTPIWSDFCIVPSAFAPQHARGFAGWANRAWNYLADTDNPTRAFLQSPAELVTVDQQAGVLCIQYPNDPESVIDRFIPTGVDNLPELSAAADVFLWQDAKLKTSHTFEAIVTVTPAVDANDEPSDARFFSVSSSTTDGEGPEIEWFVAEEVARYPHTQGLLIDSKDDAAKAAAQAGLPSNVGILAATAAAQVAASFSSYRDRLGGHVVFPGCDASKLRLFGPCRGIRIGFSPQRGLTTTYDLTVPLSAPSFGALLTPAQRRLIYGQLGPED